MQQVVRTLSNMTPAGPFHSVYDRMGNLIAETDGLGNTVREYIWLEESQSVAHEEGARSVNVPLAVVEDADTASPKLYFVHGDHLNRPIKMTDSAKASVWDAVWLPFGGAHSITGTASNNVRFPGQWFQLESDLHYNWHRHYDPTTGRYIKPDPLGLVDGPSVYAYAMSSPMMNDDPPGLTMAGPIGPAIDGGYELWDRLKKLFGGPNACLAPNTFPLRGVPRLGGGGQDPLSECLEAANSGSASRWERLCSSIPESMPLAASTSGGMKARTACRNQTYESKDSKINWCYNQFGS